MASRVDYFIESFVLRILAITTALLLTLFITGMGDYSPRIDEGAGYTALVDDTPYTSQKQDDKKFLPQKEFVLNSVQIRFFNFVTQASSIVSATTALKIRDPPAAHA
ncbi:MAG: hypothetical protein V4751_07775 [Pseudomonadota bacterium]